MGNGLNDRMSSEKIDGDKCDSSEFNEKEKNSATAVATGTHTFRERIEDGESFIPSYAGISDAHPVLQGRLTIALLVTREEIALNHDGADVVAACGKLGGNVTCHRQLLLPIFVAIAVGAIDHDTVRDALFLLGVPSFFHVSVVVIGSLS